MTRTEREHLIERYLAGELSADDELALRARLVTDRQLARELRAYMAIDRTLATGGGPDEKSWTALRASLQAQLAGGTSSSHSDTRPANSGSGRGARSSGATLAIVALMMLATTGAVYMILSGDNAPSSPVARSTSAPAGDDATDRSSAPRSSPDERPETSATPTVPTQTEALVGRRTAVGDSSTRTGSESAAVDRTRANASAPAAAIADDIDASATAHDSTARRRDSIRVDFHEPRRTSSRP